MIHDFLWEMTCAMNNDRGSLAMLMMEIQILSA